jgi:sulfite exporter TauE/SafE
METFLTLGFAAVVGFTHAFEADHLLAVSNIVTRRNSLAEAVKDGVYWGLGHTSTILAIGLLMILVRVAVAEQVFHIFEAVVGLMLIALGIHRIRKVWLHEQEHAFVHQNQQPHHHRLAYGVGLIHGLAGSGTLVLLVMTQLQDSVESIAYLLIFGLGSVAGMLLASGIFSLPFSKKWSSGRKLQLSLTLLSATLCIIFGARVVWENLAQA